MRTLAELPPLAAEVWRIRWAFDCRDDRRGEVESLSKRVAEMEWQHADLLQALSVFADEETILTTKHRTNAQALIRRIEGTR